MKTTYTANEWVKKQVDNARSSHWFLDHNNQDKLMFDLAQRLFLELEDDKTFEECLIEASGMLTDFYNYRYNPTTRTSR